MDELEHVKGLLRKYAVTTHTGNSVSCNCCKYFGLFNHNIGCELAPYVTPVEPTEPKPLGADWRWVLELFDLHKHRGCFSPLELRAEEAIRELAKQLGVK